MKKIIAPIAAIAIAITASGCMANLTAKRFSNNFPQWIDSLSKDTNACHLEIIGPGFTVKFDRNGTLNTPQPAASFSVTPKTTLEFHPTK